MFSRPEFQALLNDALGFPSCKLSSMDMLKWKLNANTVSVNSFFFHFSVVRFIILELQQKEVDHWKEHEIPV